MTKENAESPALSIGVFQLVRLAALRAKQLQAGARPRVETMGHTVLRVALLEVEAGMVSWNVADPPPTASAPPRS